MYAYFDRFLDLLIEVGWFICVSLNWVIIGSDNGLSPIWHQVIIWTNAGILSITPWKKKSVTF